MKSKINPLSLVQLAVSGFWLLTCFSLCSRVSPQWGYEGHRCASHPQGEGRLSLRSVTQYNISLIWHLVTIHSNIHWATDRIYENEVESEPKHCCTLAQLSLNLFFQLGLCLRLTCLVNKMFPCKKIVSQGIFLNNIYLNLIFLKRLMLALLLQSQSQSPFLTIFYVPAVTLCGSGLYMLYVLRVCMLRQAKLSGEKKCINEVKSSRSIRQKWRIRSHTIKSQPIKKMLFVSALITSFVPNISISKRSEVALLITLIFTCPCLFLWPFCCSREDADLTFAPVSVYCSGEAMSVRESERVFFSFH